MDESGRGPATPAREARSRGAKPPDRRRVALGSGGERLAAAWLVARGMRVIERNWRCPYGELDLIAEEAETLVFVEVKTRRGERMGTPEEAITPAKRRHLVAASLAYLAEHAREDAPYRIDVVAVQLTPAGALVAVRHYANAIALEE
ncbi:MAG: YraN family protein [Ktedonobacterales bacterium]|nr:YraN family protein [Ktedonobacterales bacterium]